MKKSLLIFLFACNVFANYQMQVDFDYPSVSGDFYVAGTVFFPPGAVIHTDNIIVIDTETKKEVPSKISVQEQWPDSSILSAEIIFPANNQRKTKYAIVYGDDVKRERTFSQTGVLPTISFTTPGAGKTAETVDISVGQINVRVDKSISLRYWWYIVPVLFLIVLTIVRTLITVRSQKT